MLRFQLGKLGSRGALELLEVGDRDGLELGGGGLFSCLRLRSRLGRRLRLRLGLRLGRERLLGSVGSVAEREERARGELGGREHGVCLEVDGKRRVGHEQSRRGARDGPRHRARGRRSGELHYYAAPRCRLFLLFFNGMTKLQSEGVSLSVKRDL